MKVKIKKDNKGKISIGINKEDGNVYILAVDKKYAQKVKEGEDWEVEKIKDIDLNKTDRYGNRLFLRLFKPVEKIKTYIIDKVEDDCAIIKVVSGDVVIDKLKIKGRPKYENAIHDNGVTIYKRLIIHMPDGRIEDILSDKKYYPFERYSPDDIPIDDIDKSKIIDTYNKWVKIKEEEERKEKRKLELIGHGKKLPDDFVVHFIQNSVKQLTKDEIDYRLPLYGQEEEVFESGDLRWKLEIAIIDEDFVEWEKAITNAGEIKNSDIISKLEDMSLYAILKNLGKSFLPSFAKKEIFKDISKPETNVIYQDSLFCGISGRNEPMTLAQIERLREEQMNRESEDKWRKRQLKIIEQKKKEAKASTKEIIQENKIIKIVWEPEIHSDIHEYTMDLDRNRGFANYLIASVVVWWYPDISFKIEIADDIKEEILSRLETKKDKISELFKIEKKI